MELKSYNQVYVLGLLLVVVLLPVRPVWAGLITGCTADTCTWEISVDGKIMMSGMYTADTVTGDIILNNPVSLTGDGFSFYLSEMSGNLDPVLGFGLGATNTSGDLKNFAFAFSLPLGGLPTPISTKAQLGTTLTAFSAAGGSVFPILGSGTIVDSQDIKISPYLNDDKNVDIGAGLSVTGKGGALNDENATGSIISGGPYDLMSVTVAFGLTDQTGVGFSGFVEQVAVPVPAAAWLFGTGLLGLAGIARRKV